MVWYILNICIITILWLNLKKDLVFSLGSNCTYKIDKNKFFCIIASINWILLSGLRSLDVGADTYSYKIDFFDKISNISWNELLTSFYSKYFLGDMNLEKDLGYRIFEKVFHIFSDNYQLYLIFIAIIFFIPLARTIYKYSSNSYLSYILFSCLFYSFFAITGLRQTIATAIVVLLGIDLIKNKKLVLFVIIILIASTIHASAICFFPFYWLSRIKISKKTLLIYWVLIILSFIFRNQMFSLLREVAGYENYGYFENASGGTFLFFLLTISLFVSIFYKKIISGNPFINMSMNALFIACIFSSMLLINPSSMRVVQYYSIFLLYIFPQCKNIFKENNRYFFNFVCVFVLIGLLIMNNPTYSFFWQI